ncbi:MAG TPA: TonB-dependent receptor [Sphingomonas sp.]|nr:TonB-dependent receptor [Sphingomonas sp.]
MLAAHRTMLTALLASSALIAPPALAKDAPAPAAPAAQAPEQQPDATVPDIIVTAQKRSESLQSVPISIVALTSAKLDQLNISNFNSYAAQLPSVTFQTIQPGTTNVYIRGVASGGDGNHSGPLPSVGVYLDEQPVTTIGGTLDVHIYDVARIESLAGPQGTLYGASSEAGTIRIITNKPDMSGFYGRVDGEVNSVAHGGVGGKLEGFINVPIAAHVAFRAVGWYQRDAGYIDNVPGKRTFVKPTFDQNGDVITDSNGNVVTVPGISVTNAAFVKNNYNDVEVAGGRAALQIDLDDGWTITPTVLAQDQHNHGSFGYDARTGDLQVQHFYPEYQHDRFIQAAMTIQGKLGNWDLTYAGAYLDRKINSSSDYTDYAEAYDSLYHNSGGLAYYFALIDNAGNTIDPRQRIVGADHFTKHSEEFRIASPTSDRFRVVAGMFYQRQTHLIHQDYQVPGLGAQVSVNGFPGTLWLTQQNRVDTDYAMFGEASFDITPTLTLTGGGRAFIYDNTLIGFFGFGRNPGGGYTASPPNGAFSSKTGVIQCFTTTGAPLGANLGGTLLPASVPGGPCTNLGVFNTATGKIDPKVASGQGFTHKLNLTWKPTSGVLLYATWSRGFRPGGINRRGTLAPYAPDYLTNYEVGFKTTLFNKSVRLNGAFYMQDWNHFQFAFLGENSFTEVHNGPNARIKGAEFDVTWTPLRELSIGASGSYTDAKTRQNLCGIDDPTYTCTGPDNFISAPKGTRLPVTPQVKLSGNARYTMPLGSGHGYLQAQVNHQSSAASDIRTMATIVGTVPGFVNPAALTGRLAAYTTADFRVGYDWGNYSAELFVQNAFDERAQLSRFQECGSCYQRPYVVTNTPRTIGFKVGAKF